MEGMGWFAVCNARAYNMLGQRTRGTVEGVERRDIV